jgi:hypothetical protein
MLLSQPDPLYLILGQGFGQTVDDSSSGDESCEEVAEGTLIAVQFLVSL